ncbi:hypothetical protein SERLA73DRAFT_109353 [Serpula lacrymans var. lacrymans S7.3]|uniref:CobW C-terminal domain-containing protein n=2 Tax=Serpula lacrymans var. lacrymans TaxID=341189 RepID=F8Q153_SERL3|nr:uncharacterized protein SERLADRAFT_469750 [Serpula lacrymans var. lacrymans S7.9]EGN98031.1 hypothetical protein SERLA73DRAFT_109353 [Serpula lacrymans var. lacrymans S7.3]EGO23622.1 hypothetical protein SERLADRAFT_469750 [Serpula lacrymans var. lacrymans S7.9]
MEPDDDEIPVLVEHSEQVDSTVAHRVPLTIICGFLGAGKSTLLKRILTERHGYRIAVIMNEFGDTADIEAKRINVSSADDPTAENSEEFLELANGCLCCSVKDAGVAAIEKLMERKGGFDHILLETTGLADPGPIASMFWQNEDFTSGLGRDICLDGVLCVVDAVFGRQQMEEDHTVDGVGESLRQIACADVVLLNKVDLTSETEVNEVEDLIHKVNPSVPIHRTVKGEIDLAHIMNINAYTAGSASSKRGNFIHEHAQCGDSHDSHDSHDTDHSNTHYQLRGISSLQISCPVFTPLLLEKFDEWIRTILWENRLMGDDTGREIKIMRCKGLFIMESGEQYMLQGVQNLYDITKVDEEITGIPDSGKLVLIGKGLDSLLQQSLQNVFHAQIS